MNIIKLIIIGLIIIHPNTLDAMYRFNDGHIYFSSPINMHVINKQYQMHVDKPDQMNPSNASITFAGNNFKLTLSYVVFDKGYKSSQEAVFNDIAKDIINAYKRKLNDHKSLLNYKFIKINNIAMKYIYFKYYIPNKSKKVFISDSLFFSSGLVSGEFNISKTMDNDHKCNIVLTHYKNVIFHIAHTLSTR